MVTGPPAHAPTMAGRSGARPRLRAPAPSSHFLLPDGLVKARPPQAIPLLEVAAWGQRLQHLVVLQHAHAGAGSTLAPLQALCSEALARRSQGEGRACCRPPAGPRLPPRCQCMLLTPHSSWLPCRAGPRGAADCAGARCVPPCRGRAGRPACRCPGGPGGSGCHAGRAERGQRRCGSPPGTPARLPGAGEAAACIW